MRTSSNILAMMDDALARLVTNVETVASSDFNYATLASVQGVAIVGIMHVALKGVELGTTLENFNVIGDTAMLASQEFVDNCVRTSLESIRVQKVRELAQPNGHPG